MTWRTAFLALALLTGNQAIAQPGGDLPRAIFADPETTSAAPTDITRYKADTSPASARPTSTFLAIPSHGFTINGYAYLAAGEEPHPALLLLYGLPGGERNIDIAQSARRAGWTVVMIDYRGAWGSPGAYRLWNTVEDTHSALAYMRDPENARKLRIDPARIVVAGHSLGGWITAMVAENDPGLLGAILISAANIGAHADQPYAEHVAKMEQHMTGLSGVTPEQLAMEARTNATKFDWLPHAGNLATVPLLVLTSDDGLAPDGDRLATAVTAAGGTRLAKVHVATDHGWSDRRIRLQSEILNWLSMLRGHR